MKKRRIRTAAAAICLALLIGGICWYGNLLHKTYSAEDLKLAEDAVRKYATTCYALEGAYPESLDYLTDNYALTLNEDEFVYHYEYIGANMMPEISVFPID
ncbi:MAG: hypothetical protein KBS66_01500 [Eubacterium sp.]|nr:hypothetical protein [Candidatus Colimonas fimequi]